MWLYNILVPFITDKSTRGRQYIPLQVLP